jgi:hypothetical protein
VRVAYGFRKEPKLPPPLSASGVGLGRYRAHVLAHV